MSHASGNATWVDYPSTATLITATTLEDIETLLDLLAAPPFARYYSAAATGFTFTGSRQRIPFATAQDTHADVTSGGSGTTFTLNRAGVWRIEAGIRMSASATSQTKYLNISNSADLTTGGYSEVQDFQTVSGGSFHTSVTRRFAAASVVCATLLISGSSTTATVATDIAEDTFISLTWVRA